MIFCFMKICCIIIQIDAIIMLYTHFTTGNFVSKTKLTSNNHTKLAKLCLRKRNFHFFDHFSIVLHNTLYNNTDGKKCSAYWGNNMIKGSWPTAFQQYMYMQLGKLIIYKSNCILLKLDAILKNCIMILVFLLPK